MFEMCFHENKREWMDYLLSNSIISVTLFLNVLLVNKYLDKTNQQNQRHYPYAYLCSHKIYMFFFILSFIQHLPLYTRSVLFGHDFLPQHTYVDPIVSNNKGNRYDHKTVEVTVRNDFFDKDWSTPLFIRVMLLVY
jgi:hypothetical protein